MPKRATPAKPAGRSKLRKAIADHPVAAAGIAAGALLGAVAVRRALKRSRKAKATATPDSAAKPATRRARKA
jgi:hypothetical protein